MEIRINIPRPLLTLTILVTGLLWWNGVFSIHWPNTEARLDAEGGSHPAVIINEARQDIDRERVKQAVLDRREEILRYNLTVLEELALASKTPEDTERLRDARTVLLSIIKDRAQSEKLLLSGLQQLWDAEGTVFSTSKNPAEIVLLWPVQPLLGISAGFNDAAYEKRFGFPHHAIDIPTAQHTAIMAPADGIVTKVSLNGLGYSYVTVEHAGKIQTTYGHITEATVTVGQEVKEGEIIAYSGGEPWTLGAGISTTGPHLHFVVREDGVLVDPLKYLPTIR